MQLIRMMSCEAQRSVCFIFERNELVFSFFGVKVIFHSQRRKVGSGCASKVKSEAEFCLNL